MQALKLNIPDDKIGILTHDQLVDFIETFMDLLELENELHDIIKQHKFNIKA